MHQITIHDIEENKGFKKHFPTKHIYKSTYNKISQHISSIFESANNVTI